MNADKLADALRTILDHVDGYVPNTPKAIWRDAQAALAEHDAQPAQAAQPVPLVADLTNALHWALRRVRTSLDTGDLYANAEAVLNRAGATLLPAQPSADAEDAAYAERVACLACVPTSWLDPLLSGPEAVVTTGQILPKHIEALLHGIRDRIAARVARPLE